MFLIIPLTLILASVIGIAFIIWRKVPYLKKLSVSDVQSGSTIWEDFFPELMEKVNNFNLVQYREIWLIELEKILRRLRVVSMRADRFSDSLIKKIRNFTAEQAETSFPEPSVETAKPDADTNPPEIIKKETAEDWKKEEQKLIIEIAKNPKDYALYEKLGDLYVKMSSFSDAKESYEAAIELNPAKEELKKKHSQATEKVLK